MSESLNNLNDEYKQMKKEATSSGEKQQIKQDYKEMKTLIKGADKLIQKHDQELRKFDKVWDKLDKEYQKLGKTPSFEEAKEELTTDEVIVLKKYANELSEDHDDPSTLNIPYEERIVVKLIDKIKELSPNVETTIAQLLQLTNEDVAKIEPLLQGKVFNNLEKACVEANLKIEVNHDEIGGLGYHYKFKKIN